MVPPPRRGDPPRDLIRSGVSGAAFLPSGLTIRRIPDFDQTEPRYFLETINLFLSSPRETCTLSGQREGGPGRQGKG